jgi:hypothetical protein
MARVARVANGLDRDKTEKIRRKKVKASRLL